MNNLNKTNYVFIYNEDYLSSFSFFFFEWNFFPYPIFLHDTNLLTFSEIVDWAIAG